MANCLLAYDNLVQRAATNVTASSAVSGLGADNLRHGHVRRRWRTVNGITSASVTFDFGAAHSLDVLVLVQPKDAGGIDADRAAQGWMAATDTVRHRLDATTAGAGVLLDTGAIQGNWVSGYGYHVYKLSTPVNARYWRIDLAAPSLASKPGFIDLGLAWAGPSLSLTRNFGFGWEWGFLDSSGIAVSTRSSLEVVDVGWPQRYVNFGLPWMTQDEGKNTVFEMQRLAGVNRQVLFIPEPGGSHQNRQAVIGRMQQIQPIAQPNLVQYSTAFQIRESL